MGPPSYMRSVVGPNLVMQRIAITKGTKETQLYI